MVERDGEQGGGEGIDIDVELTQAAKPLSLPPTLHAAPVTLPGEALGIRLGRYTLLSLLGKGGMAEVYLARQEGPAGFEKTCVVKRIRRSLVEEPRFVEMFVREARLAGRLNHPNVVQIFELGEEKKGAGTEYFLAMEYLDGVSLHRAARRVWAAEESVPMEVILRSVADAALGLHHAHTLRGADGAPTPLVHRDVSPDNIVLTRDGVSKVLDFGIAKSTAVEEQTSTGEVKGKIPFMSPEQLHGAPLDGRSDLWSLGVTLYWLLTGKRPFDGATEPLTIDGILRKEPAPPRSLNPLIPASVERIVLALLHKDRAERTASAMVLAEQLLAVLGPAGGASASAAFCERVLAMPASPHGEPPHVPSALTIVAARPESQWLKRVEAGSDEGAVAFSGLEAPGDLKRLVPDTRPTGKRPLLAPLPTPPPAVEDATRETATGLRDLVEPPRQSRALPVAAGLLAFTTLALLAFIVLREPASSTTEQAPAADVDAPGAVAVAAAPAAANPLEPAGDAKPARPDAAGAAAEPPVAPAVSPDDQKVEPPVASPGPPRPSLVESPPRGRDVAAAGAAVQAKAPGSVTWKLGKKAIGKGTTTLKVPRGTKALTAVDGETGGVSVVAVVDGVADHQALGTGALTFRVRPWANVRIGPKKLGTTPLDTVRLPAGTYRVVFSNDDATKEQTVVVRSGQSQTLTVDLRAE